MADETGNEHATEDSPGELTVMNPKRRLMLRQNLRHSGMHPKTVEVMCELLADLERRICGVPAGTNEHAKAKHDLESTVASLEEEIERLKEEQERLNAKVDGLHPPQGEAGGEEPQVAPTDDVTPVEADEVPQADTTEPPVDTSADPRAEEPATPKTGDEDIEDDDGWS